MITLTCKSNNKKLNSFFERLKESVNVGCLDKYGALGVEALMNATPIDSGTTASSWYYEIQRQNGVVSLVFKNSNIIDYVPIAVILQYGHGTGTGGWVEGIDYINPALRSVFQNLADEAWKEVTSVK